MSDSNDRSRAALGRRDLLTAAVFGGAAALAGGASARAAEPVAANRGGAAGGSPGASGSASPAARAAGEPSVAIDGNYATVPLRRDVVRVTAAQSPMRSVKNTRNPGPEMKRNVERMVELIDGANGFGGKQDLICFHEQPIMGWKPWNREELLRVCIDVPGPETEAIGQIAKKHGCYVTFGTYARDPAWPGHVLLNGVLIGPDGTVVANHWKTNNIRGFAPGYEIFTTAIYDVLDRYREMYGEDAVLPIARTDIGNLNCSITPAQPDVLRAMAMKGLEIRASSASGGYIYEDAAALSLYNRLYTIVVNQSISTDNGNSPEFAGAGDSAIIGPNGRALGRARSFNEEFITATIPMADFRRTRSVPDVPMEMLAPVHAKYTPRFGANAGAEYLPSDGADAAKYYAKKKRW